MSAPTAYSEPNVETEKARPSPCRKAAIECSLEKTAHPPGNPTGILGKATCLFRKALIACLVGVVVAGFFSGLVYGFERPIKTAARTDQEAADAEPRRTNITEEAMPATVVGVASMYNPYRATRARHGSRGKQTASGEFYDPAAWAAAIQIDLRELFGGVHYGRRYQLAYALVECCGKRAIVKINDVGPLRPGRVIDLDQRSMRYFDRSLRAGLIHDVKVTKLSGSNWTLGPLEGEQPVVVAVAQLPAANRAPAPNDGEQQVIIGAVALSGEERSSAPRGSEPAMVVAAPLTTEDWTPEPTGGKQLALVGKEELFETDIGSVDSKHFASIVPENLPGDGTEPAVSAEPEGVVAVMPVAAPSPSRKMGLATTFMLISIGGIIVALSPAASAVNTESPVVKPRSRRRRKIGPNTARTRRTTSRRKGIRKSRQKASPKSRAKIAKKTPRKTAR